MIITQSTNGDDQMNVYKNITELVGHTPVVRLDKLGAKLGLEANLFAKLECYNPTGSMKDRVGLAMIRDAEASGKLAPGGTIIEPTSGNTGIGIAAVAAYLGYKVIIVMPDSMSVERRKLMQIYGAELVLTPGAEGMSGAIARAEELVQEMDNAIIAGQFENPANPQAHYDPTGPELWEQMDGQIDALVAGVGTGGSLSGTGRYLKEKRADIEVVAVEPAASAVLGGGQAGPHAIQGIGAGFVPKALDTTIYDEVIAIANDDAIKMVGELAREEGLFMGISSAAAILAAAKWASREENKGKSVAVLLPDTGMRYLSNDDIFA